MNNNQLLDEIVLWYPEKLRGEVHVPVRVSASADNNTCKWDVDNLGYHLLNNIIHNSNIRQVADTMTTCTAMTTEAYEFSIIKKPPLYNSCCHALFNTLLFLE